MYFCQNKKLAGENVKKLICFLLLIFISRLFVYGESKADSLALYINAVEDDLFTLDEQKEVIEQAISFCQRNDYLYEELYFKEKEIIYYHSTANYGYLSDLSNDLLEQIEDHIKDQKGDKRWERLHIDILYDVGNSLVLQSNFSKGTEVFHQIITLYPENLYALAKANNGLGIISANKGVWDKALHYFTQSLDMFTQLNEQSGIFKSYSNIGLLYLSQNNFQESLSNFLKAHQVVIETGNTGEKQIYANYYIAMAYSGIGNYEQANAFFNEAIKIAKEKQHRRLLCFSQFNYAKNLFNQGNYTQAKKEAELSLQYFTESSFTAMKAEALSLLAKIYEKGGDYKAALDFQNQYAEMLNEFLKTEKEENLKKLENSIEGYKLQNKIIDLELTKAKLSYRNLLISILVLISILLLSGLIILSRKFFLQRKLNDSTMQHMEDIKEKNKERVKSIEEHMSQELDVKNKELLSNSLLFLRLSNVASMIMEKLTALKKGVSFKPKDKVLVYEIENLVSELALDKDWGEFEIYFQQIDNEFLNKLSDKFPSLSPTEKRMCVLFRLDLKNREIATLMQKTHQSVSMAKIRIKRKLNVESNEELVSLLNSL